jgi:hypothetical protein
MGIGNYKQIRLYRYQPGLPSLDGNYSESVGNTYNLWAEVTDDSGSRTLSDGMVTLNNNKTFKIFYRGYNPYGNYRIEYYGDNYEVVGARRVEEKRFNWVLTARSIL